MKEREKEFLRLSKYLSFILRHKPKTLGVKLDNQGFTDVNLEELARRIRGSSKRWKWVKAADIEEIVEKDEKGRFEIMGGRIRAKYGHSLPYVKPFQERGVKPPQTLYHGTMGRVIDKILKEGIKPMGRNMVHLTSSLREAVEVASRRKGEGQIIVINALKAFKEGTMFWRASKNIYCTKYVHPRYIVEIKKVRDIKSSKT